MAKKRSKTAEGKTMSDEKKTTMSLTDVLSKLSEAETFLRTRVPDGLDATADVAEKVSDACRQAADYLRNFKVQATGEQAEELARCCNDLNLLRSRCHATAAGGGRMATGVGVGDAGLSPEMVSVLAQMISQVITLILSRLGR